MESVRLCNRQVRPVALRDGQYSEQAALEVYRPGMGPKFCQNTILAAEPYVLSKLCTRRPGRRSENLLKVAGRRGGQLPHELYAID